MKTLKSESLAKFLYNDPLYGNEIYLENIKNSLSDRNLIKVIFRGISQLYMHAYGSLEMSNEIKDCEFFMWTKETKERFDNLKSYLKTSVAATIEGERYYFIELGNISDAIKIDRYLHAELVTLFICTGLKSAQGESIKSYDINEFKDIVSREYDDVLLDALENMKFRDEDLREYLTKNKLPLPSLIYPHDKNNTKVFMEMYNLDTWDSYDPGEVFDEFYKKSNQSEYVGEPIKNMPVENNNREIDNMVKYAKKSDSDKSSGCAFYRQGQVWFTEYKGIKKSFSKLDGYVYIHAIMAAEEKGIFPEDLDKLTVKKNLDILYERDGIIKPKEDTDNTDNSGGTLGQEFLTPEEHESLNIRFLDAAYGIASY